MINQRILKVVLLATLSNLPTRVWCESSLKVIVITYVEQIDVARATLCYTLTPYRAIFPGVHSLRKNDVQADVPRTLIMIVLSVI